MATKKEIKEILDTVKLSQTGWESSEDIVLFNGSPIGMTITKHSREFDRWYPEFKEKLAELLAEKLEV